MKFSFLLHLSLLMMLSTQVGSAQAPATEATPLWVAQAQLDAYNRQDAKAFAALFAPEVEVFNRLGDTIPSLKGRQAVEERYAALFKSYPNNYSTLTGRIVQGNYVIDHEYVTGREKPVEIVAIYEVKEGLITRCWFIR